MNKISKAYHTPPPPPPPPPPELPPELPPLLNPDEEPGGELEELVALENELEKPAEKLEALKRLNEFRSNQEMETLSSPILADFMYCSNFSAHSFSTSKAKA